MTEKKQNNGEIQTGDVQSEGVGKGVKKTIAFGIMTLTAVSALAVGAYAYGPTKYLYENNVAIQESIDANDYDAFIGAVSEIDMDAATRITESQFNKIADRFDTKELVEEAIENRDYNAWVAAIADMPHGADMADVVSEDEFDLLIELHENRERNKEIAQEIGLDNMKHETARENFRDHGGRHMGKFHQEVDE